MKDLLNSLPVSMQELADLLMIPKATLQSWMSKDTSWPDRYRPYIRALRNYAQSIEAIPLPIAPLACEATHLHSLQQTIAYKLARQRHQLTRLELTQQKWQQRLHLANHLALHFLASPLPPRLADWLALLKRQSLYELNNPDRLARQCKIKLTIAGLEAQQALLNDWLADSP